MYGILTTEENLESAKANLLFVDGLKLAVDEILAHLQEDAKNVAYFYVTADQKVAMMAINGAGSTTIHYLEREDAEEPSDIMFDDDILSLMREIFEMYQDMVILMMNTHTS